MSAHNNTITCGGCGNSVPCTQQEELPDNGWHLPYEHFGYYGGFSDETEVLFGMRESKGLTLCHDCVVKVITVLPKFAESLERGTHPCDSETPCCEWAWRSKDGELEIVSPDKQWCFMPLPPVR